MDEGHNIHVDVIYLDFSKTFDKVSHRLLIYIHVDVIYLDFSKTFDKVSHRLLIYKLEKYGIRGKILDWIREYLTNLKQRVAINGILSSTQPVTSGVPQGRVIGPVLFLIYVNDMPDVVKCIIKLFADDTKLFSKISPEEDQTLLQYSINQIIKWTDSGK